MARRTTNYLLLEASEKGPWIRYELGYFYACIDGNPCNYYNGEEFSKLKSAVSFLGKELFKEEDLLEFEKCCDAIDKVT